jgi:DeoR/GlpR family transcriptional regulator of sugar metabolism
MHKTKRTDLILQSLQQATFMSVKELTRILGASEATVRRDLVKLEDEKQIRRIHGGAEPIDKNASQNLNNTPFALNQISNIDKKRRIAAKAAELCRPNESVIIEGGTTTYMMADYIKHLELVILTDSLFLAVELTMNSKSRIIISGGEVLRDQNIILNPFQNDIAQNYSAQKMFMGIHGITKNGLMQTDSLLLRSQEKLINQADQLIVLADSSKFGRQASLILCPLNRIDIIITDDGIDDETRELLDRADIKIYIV